MAFFRIMLHNVQTNGPGGVVPLEQHSTQYCPVVHRTPYYCPDIAQILPSCCLIVVPSWFPLSCPKSRSLVGNIRVLMRIAEHEATLGEGLTHRPEILFFSASRERDSFSSASPEKRVPHPTRRSRGPELRARRDEEKFSPIYSSADFP